MIGQRVRRLQARAGRLVFERGLPVETESWTHPEGLDANPERTRYEPSPYFTLARALRGMRIGPEHTFIDYGSGRGRVVMLAARRPFGRAIGVEIDEPLNVDARRNLASVQDKLRCRQVEFLSADALTWQPGDDITHAYFYNPFSGAIFDAVIGSLIASFDRAPRPMWIIYANPTLAERLEATGRVRLERRFGSRVRKVLSRQVAVYRIVPAERPAG